jgi:hypothetical protein
MGDLRSPVGAKLQPLTYLHTSRWLRLDIDHRRDVGGVLNWPGSRVLNIHWDMGGVS